jgi:2-oxoglutarate dehydrogenase E1 component
MPARASIIGWARWTTRPSSRALPGGPSRHLGISKVITLTSTYDHRIIQGAESAASSSRSCTALLLGEDGFYDDIFHLAAIPYEPVRWARRPGPTDEDDLGKPPACRSSSTPTACAAT